MYTHARPQGTAYCKRNPERQVASVRRLRNARKACNMTALHLTDLTQMPVRHKELVLLGCEGDMEVKCL